jgi:hypothetical protein
VIAVKVTFLNDELTEAQLQRGVLWWRRLAIVRLATENRGTDTRPAFRTAWTFTASGEECSEWLANAIDRARTSEKLSRLDAKDWQRPSRLPRAHVHQLPDAQVDQ